MKVIDLIKNFNLNKEMPKKIKVNGSIFTHNGLLIYTHQDFDKESYLFTDDYNWADLLDNEVEIIEENNKIEKLESLNTDYYAKELYYERLSKEEITLDIQSLKHWINKIIDVINNN